MPEDSGQRQKEKRSENQNCQTAFSIGVRPLLKKLSDNSAQRGLTPILGCIFPKKVYDKIYCDFIKKS